jgi:hypothetical protein
LFQLRFFQALLLILFGVVAWHFLDSFPNGWDQAEYCWAIQSDYLPHSPYIFYFLLGKMLGVVLSAPAALAALSFVSGLLALWLLTGTAARLLGSEEGPTLVDHWAATLAALLVGGTFVFVRQAGTQEIYLLQCCLLVGAAYSVTRAAGARQLLLCGIMCGAAVALHSGSVFALPALGWLALARADRPRGQLALLWIGSLSITAAIGVALVAALLPTGVELSSYLLGIAPPVTLERIGDPRFLSKSIAATLQRLTNHDIPIVRFPPETGPLGLSFLHLGAGAVGAGIALWRSRRIGIFVVLWAAPYFAYEIALGWSIDWGVYTVFLLPALALTLAFLFRPVLATVTLLSWWGRGSALLLVAMVAAAVVPNVVLFANHWNDAESDQLEHFSDLAIAALWIREHASSQALVLQPSSEGNVNILPYYSQRQHALIHGPRFEVFDAFGVRFSPLNSRSYSLLTTERLDAWIRAGREIIAFERNPLERMDRGLINPERFGWSRAQVISLQEVAARHDLPTPVQNRVAGRRLILYRAQLK